MKLSIITINYNNASGLRKTLASVAAQTYRNIEHIIVDGGSSDGSVDVIKEYESLNHSSIDPLTIVWSSEPDRGIYDAMSKGVKKATGDYVWILNSGDCVASPMAIEKMMGVLKRGDISMLLGNIIHVYPNGKNVREKKYHKQKEIIPMPIETSMFTFYTGTIPQDAAFVRRDLYQKYGYFDESMKICADWKLYLNMIALDDVIPMYVNIDVVLFDMTGISNANNELRLLERRQYIEKIIPPSILKDYDQFGDDISIMQRLHRYPIAYRVTRFIERVLFKLEKWNILNN